MFGMAASLCLLLWSCERTQNTENKEIAVEGSEPGDTARVIKTGQTAEDRLEDMREWMSDRTTGDDTIENDTSSMRKEFKRRTAELDARMDSLSEKSRAEYQQLKDRYNNWEARQQRRQQTPLQPNKLKQWQDQLLREFKDLQTVTPANVREAYLTFMGVVRAKRQNWTQDDWDYVDYVYGQLNERKRQIDDNMSTGDLLKVKALQAEYLTLEGAADTQSMIGTMRD